MDREPPDGPPIAVPLRSHSYRHAHHHPSNSRTRNGASFSARPGINTNVANPEIISDLISSLSASHFDSLPIASPTSPLRTDNRSTGFTFEQRDPVDDIATSPIVRTAKHPSGYTTASQPKSPRASSNDRASGIRSFIRASSLSRPSSPGSIGSRNDDSTSIGNLSIEPGPLPDPELRPRRSYDSWGKKTGRRQKDMLYMSSKERLREKDLDRKWAAGSTVPASGASSVHSGGRADPFLAETAISEEPGLAITTRFSTDSYNGAQAIPNRESSLRKPSTKKRSSTRRSRQNSEDTVIPEIVEYGRSGAASRTSHKRVESEAGRSFLFDVDEYAAVTQALDDEYERENGHVVPKLDIQQRSFIDDIDHEPAPSPAISSGRRAYERDQNHIGRLSPYPSGDLSSKRSNSRLKRLSGTQPTPVRTSEHSDRPAHPVAYERPESADSIDDAVESYLCSPRLSQKITHPQTGRIISFSEVGDPEGSAVFCCVGMGLTRYITTFYDELALTLKLRLITPDRPGVGDSEPYTDGTTTPLSWPDDVYAICQALKITKFSILAHSAGAIYALATALRMPQHIRGRIHLLAPWIPPSQMSVFGASSQAPPTHSIPTSQRILRALPTPFLKAANSSFMSATSSSITSSLPKTPRRSKRKSSGSGRDSRNATPSERDLAELATINTDNADRIVPTPDATENMDRMHPPQSSMYAGSGFEAAADKERQVTYDTRLTHAIWDLATTGANPAVDLLVCLERRHTIGFRYVDITRPVVIHHGSKDNRVPVDNVKWLGKSMRRCEVRVLEGEGHGLMASATVMGSVLMEMSKEWEDWMRVTGDDSRHRERGRRASQR